MVRGGLIFGRLVRVRHCLIMMYNNVCVPQAVHVAAQYGQTSFLNHIVAKYHADFDVPDNEGRSPLHWYAKRLLACMF